jgi:hypothetical protein
VPSLPVLAPGARVRLAVESVDLVDCSVALGYRETLAEAGSELEPGAEREAR